MMDPVSLAHEERNWTAATGVKGDVSVAITRKTAMESTWTYLASIGRPVSASTILSLIHGGGVMGRRSCQALVVSERIRTFTRKDPPVAIRWTGYRDVPCHRNRTYERGWAVGQCRD